MDQIRVLVVDDSAFAREVITAILSTDNDIKVIGEAVNGKEAIEKVQKLRPDIATMDIEMPVMDGLEAIEQIMATCATPILVVTTRGDAKTAYAAISKGALDLVVKPDVNLEGAREFIEKIKLLSKVHVITHLNGKRGGKEVKHLPKSHYVGRPVDSSMVAIASSTGGPDALSVILSSFPQNFPWPVVVAQHISDGFVSVMVEWLKKITKVDVKVAEEGEPIRAGTVYISQSEKHMEIKGNKTIAFTERQPTDIYRPSCDALLSSVARVYGPKSIGVILTGMGTDGVLGIRKIKEAGGMTIAQDENSSVVFGMPKVAIESGYIDKIMPLSLISSELLQTVSTNKV